jgi:hypothetical protein
LPFAKDLLVNELRAGCCAATGQAFKIPKITFQDKTMII